MADIRKKFENNVKQHRSRLRRFLTKVENNPPENLDIIAEQIDKEIWKQVDCLACSNCCRNMTPTYSFKDMQRISGHFSMTIKQFKEKWLFKNRKGEWMNKSTPCQFLDLKTNMCSIYAIRPADCAEFPHLTKKPMPDYMHVHRQNVVHCPATFKMVEKLMDKIKELHTIENV